MKRVEFAWPDELVAAIDAVRGDVPRTKWVQRALESALGGRPGPETVAGSPAESPAPPRVPAPTRAPKMEIAFEAREAMQARQARLNKAKGS